MKTCGATRITTQHSHDYAVWTASERTESTAAIAAQDSLHFANAARFVSARPREHQFLVDKADADQHEAKANERQGAQDAAKSGQIEQEDF